MTQTILCAVDINRVDAENSVLKTASELATMRDAQLDVITVVPDFGMSVVGAYFQDHHVKSAQNDASELLKAMTLKTLGEEADSKVRHIVAIGSVYEEVLRAAELSKADLIVLGAHRPDLKDYLLGPNAARVVRHSTCSVYVVRG
ncbi:Universal stress protein F [Aliiroseovarius pelagivivens]|uniref:Universal stress protein F n=1 Tax=Aliiroseovarius pelagivivens TaxID=1639690 RepID=A0A2R8AM36_9RHOB|nr:universal stress protein [Aliiroseovarius pelagivivens]SPF77102.1 Universal stress protein F [Aliiroseovarius pelagivivens]